MLKARNLSEPECEKALESLCKTYWYPLYFFARRKGFSEHDAQDLIQSFFAKLIEKQFLDAVDRSHGKFRTFLLTALNHFICNQIDRNSAQKRGGGAIPISIDLELAEGRFQSEPVSSGAGPEEEYERAWAETLVDHVMERLRAEAVGAGQLKRFEALVGCILGQLDLGYAELGSQLSMTEAGIKTAVRRLRQRFGSILREELAATVSSPEETDEELRRLLAVLRK